MKHTEKIIMRSFGAQGRRAEIGVKMGIFFGDVEKVIEMLPHLFVLCTIVLALLEYVDKRLLASQ